MSRFRAAVVGLAGLGMLACLPRLQGDGHYACRESADCPGSLPHCHADGRCYLLPETPMPDAGPESDAGSGLWAPCYAPSYMCEAGQACVHDESETQGYCTVSIRPGVGCPSGSVQGAPGQCRLRCDSDASCPTGTTCAWARWQGTDVVGACSTSADVNPSGTAAECTITEGCMRPLSCINGRCMRTCSGAADTESCGRGELSAPVPDGDPWCVVACPSGETCPSGTSCQSPGGAPPVCLPM